LFQDVITSFGIDSDDIWNFDETGFRIGVGRDLLGDSHNTYSSTVEYGCLFQPYKHYHTKALDVAVRDGCTRFNKVEFLSAIGEIRRQKFKESTIKSAFRKTVIIPFKLSLVLSQFPSQSPAELKSEPTTSSRSSTGRHNPDVLKTTPLTIRSLKHQSDFLYENAPQDDPEFTEVLDKSIRGSVLQSTEGLQSMRDLRHDSPNM
jgi:hypothetical protein